MLSISKVRFGELDARNEVFQQNRNDSNVFFNSFQIPPTVDFDSLLNGAHYFISGQKGTGKTALIWYLKHKIELDGGCAEIVLFKSNLTEPERQRIASLRDTSVFSDQGNIEIQYDYKANWLWFIIRTIARMIKDEDLISGHDALHDIKELSGVNKSPHQTIFSGLQFTKIKAAIDSGIKTGFFKSGLKAEIEASYSNKTQDILEVISACERAMTEIVVRPNKRCCVLFDELELFLNKEDQRDRDLALIRDLLYAVSRINRNFGGKAEVVVYASVRSEVLQEVNRVGPEIRRDVSDFGTVIAWDAKPNSHNQPILTIIEAKIQSSELEYGLSETEDVWGTYFPSRIFGRDAKQYLLDISMHKPRNLVRRLKFAQKAHGEGGGLSVEDFDASTQTFSADVWSEMEDDLISTYTPLQVAAIKSVLSGFQVKFNVQQLQERIEQLSRHDQNVNDQLGRTVNSAKLIGDLYRIGAIGNVFKVGENQKSEGRDRWVFRNFQDPLFDKPFVIHESLKKTFQLLH